MTICVPINNDRIDQAAVRTAFQDLLTGFIDGFFDCEMRTSNTGNTGLGNFVIYSAYGIGGGIGVFYRKLFNLR
ncbi:hypothetical protein CRE_03453 [Caenorhabditis remanei]|uniref:Uncharacterized protein n=1 Tax=Caenorhabditis remanei TaxID=31234 RepID=E3NE48_CAERE|nr:hypothetical protein CRE_03453 [Caenorhabditis remanei]